MSETAQDERTGRVENGFEDLPKRTQIRRLRQLAGVALAYYDLPPSRLTLLSHFSNITFRVDTPTRQRYVLRVHRVGTPTVESVGAELAWLAALRRDTLLEVPAPVANREGSLLTVASASIVPRPYICVLFRWMPGQRLRQGLTPMHLERVGELMGHLHNHASQWERPPGFTRGRVDWPIETARWLADPFASDIIASIRTLVADTLSEEEAERVVAVLEDVRLVEQALGMSESDMRSKEGEQATFGLIHADLHYRNLLFGRGTVRAIDFDDCGFGPLLYDPAVMLSELLDWPAYPALRAGLLAGYRRVRPLPAEHEAHLDTFIALRRVQDAIWMLNSRENPVLSDDWVADARQALAQLEALVAL